MLDFLKSLLQGEHEKPTLDRDEFQISLCAVLLEVASVDGELAPTEAARIDHLIAAYFQLDSPALARLKKEAEAARRERTDLYSFTKSIRQNCSSEEREKILEMIWKVVYADGYIDKYEESICRRLAEMIGLNHNQYIAAKQKIGLE